MAAPGPFIVPNKAKLNLVNATNLLGANPANFYMALVGPGWNPDNSDTGNEVFGDVGANEIAAGNGYVAGGQNLTGVALSLANGTVKFTANTASWTGTGAGFPAWRRAVIYYKGTLNGKVNPILAHVLGDSMPADVPATTPANSPLTITPNAAGVLALT